jgi:hypothetical protein
MRLLRVSIPAALAALFALLAWASPARAQRECSFDLWDWTPPCKDLAKFRVWAEDLKSVGFNRLVISAPWRLLEPRPGEYDLKFVEERVAVAKALGLGLRIRINSYYAGATPDWLKCDLWQDASGKTPIPIPSIDDPMFWARFAPLCTAIARRFHGEDIVYCPFIGVHGELKWSEWWSYAPSSMAIWRESIRAPRPAWLRRVAGDAELPERPPVPAATAGLPDTSPASRAWIAFREERWRVSVQRFVAAIRAGDAHARISVPLGESYRRQSAEMSNLDYAGLSAGADQVSHSYDFFWHARQDPWYAGASVAAFSGITRLPVCFEFDGPNIYDQFGYTDAELLGIGDAALAEGAGFNVANYSYSDRLPSSWPCLVELARRAKAAPAADRRLGRRTAPGRTILLFISKWANYSYREPTDWLHDAQFGAWHMLCERGLPVRIVCEDNLGEALRGYRGIYVAFSPPELIPADDRAKLNALCAAIPSVIELAATPSVAASARRQADGPSGPFPLTAPGLPVAPSGVDALGAGWTPHAGLDGVHLLAVRGRSVALGFPLAGVWLHGADRAACDRLLDWAIDRTWRAGR